MSKRAVILSGGMGTRLHPYTVAIPKPLMPIGESPILEIIIRQLSYYGFNHITLAVNHQAEIIKAYFSNGNKWGVKIDYSLEDKPLSTIGPLKLINDLEENFLVMNGDVLTDIDFEMFFNSHVESGDIFTISSFMREELVDYGVLEISNGFLKNMQEKPKIPYEVSMGIYMVSKNILDYIPYNEIYGFNDLMRDLIIHDKKIAVIRYFGYWLDIGRPSDYLQAVKEFEKSRSFFLK